MDLKPLSVLSYAQSVTWSCMATELNRDRSSMPHTDNTQSPQTYVNHVNLLRCFVCVCGFFCCFFSMALIIRQGSCLRNQPRISNDKQWLLVLSRLHCAKANKQFIDKQQRGTSEKGTSKCTCYRPLAVSGSPVALIGSANDRRSYLNLSDRGVISVTFVTSSVCLRAGTLNEASPRLQQYRGEDDVTLSR